MPDIDHIIENHIYFAYTLLLVWMFIAGEMIVIIAGISTRAVARWSSWPPTVRGFIHEVALGVRRHVDRHDPVPVLLSPAIR